jgi:hypothetical protein
VSIIGVPDEFDALVRDPLATRLSAASRLVVKR